MNLTLRLPPAVAEQVERAARASGTSCAEIVAVGAAFVAAELLTGRMLILEGAHE